MNRINWEEGSAEQKVTQFYSPIFILRKSLTAHFEDIELDFFSIREAYTMVISLCLFRTIESRSAIDVVYQVIIS